MTEATIARDFPQTTLRQTVGPGDLVRRGEENAAENAESRPKSGPSRRDVAEDFRRIGQVREQQIRFAGGELRAGGPAGLHRDRNRPNAAGTGDIRGGIADDQDHVLAGGAGESAPGSDAAPLLVPLGWTACERAAARAAAAMSLRSVQSSPNPPYANRSHNL